LKLLEDGNLTKTELCERLISSEEMPELTRENFWVWNRILNKADNDGKIKRGK